MRFRPLALTLFSAASAGAAAAAAAVQQADVDDSLRIARWVCQCENPSAFLKVGLDLTLFPLGMILLTVPTVIVVAFVVWLEEQIRMDCCGKPPRYSR